MTAIRCQGLTRRFGEVLALDRLDLTVPAGAVYGFLGPNGAGKTTTIRLLTGLAHATAGQVWIAGVEVAAQPLEARRHLGYLPEQPAFYRWMTAAETLRLIGQLHGIDPGASRTRAAELLERTGLAGVAHRRVGGFSRGMQQRLGLAAALVHRPPILLLDEPASALDPAGRREVLELIAELRGEVTIFMSTHILSDVERVCDVVGILREGTLIIEAPRDELLERSVGGILELEYQPPALLDAVPALLEQLRAHPRVARVEHIHNVLRVQVGEEEELTPQLLELAARSRLRIRRVELMRPTLEDLFLHLTEGGS